MAVPEPTNRFVYISFELIKSQSLSTPSLPIVQHTLFHGETDTSEIGPEWNYYISL